MGLSSGLLAGHRFVLDTVIPILVKEATASAVRPVCQACQQRGCSQAIPAASVQKPFRSPPGAPGLRLPWMRHRDRLRTAGHWQDVPARVLAPHRRAFRKFASRSTVSWFKGVSSRMPFSPCLRVRRHTATQADFAGFSAQQDPPQGETVASPKSEKSACVTVIVAVWRFISGVRAGTLQKRPRSAPAGSLSGSYCRCGWCRR